MCIDKILSLIVEQNIADINMLVFDICGNFWADEHDMAFDAYTRALIHKQNVKWQAEWDRLVGLEMQRLYE